MITGGFGIEYDPKRGVSRAWVYKDGDRNAEGLIFRDGRWHRDNGQKIDEIENAHIENSMVSIGLSPESVRDTRIARKIAAAPNPADKARLQGYYDFMLSKDNAAKKQSKISEVSYLQGWKRGQDQRERLNGLPWYETEKYRDGGKWSWSIYREGLHQKSGEASSEKNADLDIEVAKADLMDAHDDWSKKGKPVNVDSAPTDMGKTWRAGLSESTCPSETALIAERNCREAIRSAKGGAA